MRRYRDIQSTRRALVVSVILLAICCLVFASSTFAWFTSSISNASNQIKTGSVAIQLSGAGSEKIVMAPQDGAIDWRPGEHYQATVTVANEGSLDLSYRLSAWIVPSAGASANSADGVADLRFARWLCDARFSPVANSPAVQAGNQAASETSPYGQVRNLPKGQVEQLSLDLALSDELCNAFAGAKSQIAVCAVAAQQGAPFGNEALVIDGKSYRFVSAVDDLAWMGEQLSVGADFANTTFVLCADLEVPTDLTLGTSEHPFAGNFDGCGHVISRAAAEGFAVPAEPVPLFGALSGGATICDLSLKLSDVSVQADSVYSLLAPSVKSNAQVIFDNVAIECGQESLPLSVSCEDDDTGSISLLAVGQVNSGAHVTMQHVRMFGTIDNETPYTVNAALCASNIPAERVECDAFCFTSVHVESEAGA